MAFLACVPGRNAAVGLCGGRCPRSFHYVGDKHLVLFEHAHPVAPLAGEIPVFTHLPRLKRLLHQVAFCTEFGIFLRILVIAEAYDAPRDSKEQEKQYDRLLIFLDKTLTKRGNSLFLRHP